MKRVEIRREQRRSTRPRQDSFQREAEVEVRRRDDVPVKVRYRIEEDRQYNPGYNSDVV
jgi:hypothetical protein